MERPIDTLRLLHTADFHMDEAQPADIGLLKVLAACVQKAGAR